MSFSLKLKEHKPFTKVIETLSAFVDECKIDISPDAVAINAMDHSRICLLRYELPKERFDEFKCPKSTNATINLEDFNKILMRANANETVSIEKIDKEPKIKVVFSTEGTRKRTFTIAELDSQLEEIPMENLYKIEYPSKIVFDPAILVEAIKDAEIYSEILSIKTNETGVKFSSVGQIGEMEYALSKDDLISSSVLSAAASAYSITFLKMILKIVPAVETLELRLKSDHPMSLLFALKAGKLDYFLAPRVEEADNAVEDDLEEANEDEPIE